MTLTPQPPLVAQLWDGRRGSRPCHGNGRFGSESDSCLGVIGNGRFGVEAQG